MIDKPDKLDKSVRKISLFVGYFFMIAAFFTIVSIMAFEQWRKFEAQVDLMPQERK